MIPAQKAKRIKKKTFNCGKFTESHRFSWMKRCTDGAIGMEKLRNAVLHLMRVRVRVCVSDVSVPWSGFGGAFNGWSIHTNKRKQGRHKSHTLAFRFMKLFSSCCSTNSHSHFCMSSLLWCLFLSPMPKTHCIASAPSCAHNSVSFIIIFIIIFLYVCANTLHCRHQKLLFFFVSKNKKKKEKNETETPHGMKITQFNY